MGIICDKNKRVVRDRYGRGNINICNLFVEKPKVVKDDHTIPLKNIVVEGE